MTNKLKELLLSVCRLVVGAKGGRQETMDLAAQTLRLEARERGAQTRRDNERTREERRRQRYFAREARARLRVKQGRGRALAFLRKVRVWLTHFAPDLTHDTRESDWRDLWLDLDGDTLRVSTTIVTWFDPKQTDRPHRMGKEWEQKFRRNRAALIEMQEDLGGRLIEKHGHPVSHWSEVDKTTKERSVTLSFRRPA
jgi:hypothetical protein